MSVWYLGVAHAQMQNVPNSKSSLSFIVHTSAVYSGYVAVDWNKVKDDAIAKVDTVRTRRKNE